MSTSTPSSVLGTLLLLLALAAGCTTGNDPTMTAPNLPDVTPTPSGDQPTATPASTATPATGPWPDGWELAFCAAFEDMVIAQELARDIGRAFDDGARDDAAALARELTSSVEEVRTLLAELPEWAEAAAFVEAAAEMLDQDDRLVTFWLRHIEQGRRPALQNARTVAAALRDELVPAVQSELRVLAGLGVSCPGQELRLETP